MIQTAVLSSFCFFSAGILSFFNNCLQNTKLVNIRHFGIKKELKLLKTCHKNGLKIFVLHSPGSSMADRPRRKSVDRASQRGSTEEVLCVRSLSKDWWPSLRVVIFPIAHP